MTGGTIRTAPALAAVSVLRDLGFDPEPTLARAGWSASMLGDPDKPVPFATLGRLLAAASEDTGYQHIGLLVGRRAGSGVLGVVGFAALNAPDVRSALQLATAHLSHHDRGGVATLVEQGDVATLIYRICHLAVPGSEQINDGALTIIFQLMKNLCGLDWQPLEVSLARRRPADLRPYHTQFGKRIRFDAEESALVFPAFWLDRKVAGADPELQRLLLRTIGAETVRPENGLRDEVRRVLAGVVGSGDANQAAVARTFGMSCSTLQRHLADAGTSFRDLLDEVRAEIACRLLEDTAVPLAQLAIMLGYSEASAFTRSFKRQLGCGPAAWRASREVVRMPKACLTDPGAESLGLPPAGA